MSISAQWDLDAERIYQFIVNHRLKHTLIGLYMEGPKKEDGFLYWDDDLIQTEVKDYIHTLGYDGAAYSLMQKKVQSKIRVNFQV